MSPREGYKRLQMGLITLLFCTLNYNYVFGAYTADKLERLAEPLVYVADFVEDWDLSSPNVTSVRSTAGYNVITSLSILLSNFPRHLISKSISHFPIPRC